MAVKLPRAGFLVATALAALAIVGGAGAIFLEVRDHTNHFLGPAIEASLGIALLTLAVTAESSGRARKIAVVVRNSLIVLFAVIIVLIFVLMAIGPLH